MILVIGGRSKIGAALIDGLLGRGEDVRALVRTGESTDDLAPRSNPSAVTSPTKDRW